MAAVGGAGTAAPTGPPIPPITALLTDRQLAETREAFLSFAVDGVILKPDLAAALKAIGQAVPEAQLKLYFDQIAPSGKMDYAGFLTVIARQLSEVRTPSAIVRAFQQFDPDLKGFVTTAEFRKIMSEYGDAPLPAELVDSMLADADPEDSGQIEYDAFVRKVFAEIEGHEQTKANATNKINNATGGGKGGKK